MALNKQSANFSTNTTADVPGAAIHMGIWFACVTAVQVAALVAFSICIVAIVSGRTNRGGIGLLILHQIFVEGLLTVIMYPITNVISFRLFHKHDHQVHCAALYLVLWWLGTASNWNALGIAINRFVALFVPHHFQYVSSRRGLIAGIVVSHLLGLAGNLLGYFGVTFQLGRLPSGECGALNISKSPLIDNIRLVFNYYIPLLGAGLVYALTILRYTIKMHRQVTGPAEDVRSVERKTRRYQLTLTFFATYLFFFICYVPSPILLTFSPALFARSRLVILWFRFLLMVGYLANPVILLTRNDNYRTALLKVWRAWRKYATQMSNLVDVPVSSGRRHADRLDQNQSRTLND